MILASSAKKKKKKKEAELANSVDLDEVALREPPHLNLHSFPSCL